MIETADGAIETAWRLLVRGAGDRRSPCHTPVVASIGRDGLPETRVMVLRQADRAAARLRFHTDARSPKVASLDGRAVSVLAYHPGEAMQLRIAGTARVVSDAPEVDAIWQAATPFARRCYLVEAAPGSAVPAPMSGLPDWVEGRKPSEDELVPARANFAVLWVDVSAIDLLHLAQTGHRRVQLRRGPEGWAAAWVVP